MSPPTRLVYFSDSFIPSRFANSVQVMKMCRAFGSAGAQVTLLARRGEEENDGTPHAYYGVEPCFTIGYLPRLPTRMGKYGVGLWGAATAWLRRAGLVYGRSVEGCYFAALLGIPAVFEAHFPPGEMLPFRRVLLERLIRSRHFRGLVVISRALKTEFEQYFAHQGLEALVFPDAADPPGEAASLPGRLDSRGKEFALRVGYVGHLYPGKGMETIHQLARRCPWAEFHVAGGTEPLLEEWREICAGMSNVVFHGFLPPAHTDGLRLACDVLIAPYGASVRTRLNMEIAPWMSPLKLFEYMAAGKAILCSDLPVLREVMEHERTCLLCRPDDMAGWENALIRLREDPQLRERLGNAAREEFLRHYSWDARAVGILKAIS